MMHKDTQEQYLGDTEQVNLWKTGPVKASGQQIRLEVSLEVLAETASYLLWYLLLSSLVI